MAAVKYTGFRWVRSNKFYNPNVGRGAILFNGPDGIRNHKTKILDPHVIGIGTISPEGTSNLDYVMRASKGCPHPRPKSRRVGEIGWEVSSVREDHVKLWRSGHQIKQGENRLSCDLRHTHLYQNPWYPPRRSHQQVTVIDLKNSKDASYKLQPRSGSWSSSATSATISQLQKPIILAK